MLNRNYVFGAIAIAAGISIILLVFAMEDSRYADPEDAATAEKLLLKMNGFNYDAERILEQCRRVNSQTEYERANENWYVLLDKVDLLDFEIGQLKDSELGIKNEDIRSDAFKKIEKWMYLRAEVNTCFDRLESR